MPIHTSKDPRATYPAYGFAGFEKAGIDVDTTGWVLVGDVNGVKEPIQANLDRGRIQFTRTVTISSAAAATPIAIVADAEVPAGKKVYVTGVIGRVNGATVWATTATVKIQDTNGTPVDFATFAVAALTANARVYLGTPSVTTEDAIANGTGGTAAKGIRLVGDANGTGSNFIVTVVGYIA